MGALLTDPALNPKHAHWEGRVIALLVEFGQGE